MVKKIIFPLILCNMFLSIQSFENIHDCSAAFKKHVEAVAQLEEQNILRNKIVEALAKRSADQAPIEILLLLKPGFNSNKTMGKREERADIKKLIDTIFAEENKILNQGVKDSSDSLTDCLQEKSV